METQLNAAPPTNDQVLDGLAILTPFEYAQRRDAAAEHFRIRVKDLDTEVAKRRKLLAPEAEEPLDFGITITEPWPDTVRGDQLLDLIASTLKRFIVFQTEEDITQCLLWTVGTHCYDEFDIFPRLNVTAVSKGCGKTSLIRLLEDMMARSLSCDNLSTAYVYRVIEAASPVSLVVDELDSFIADNSDLLGVLNSGHKKGGFVGRIEKEGESLVPRRFKTFAPVLYGMIGRPPGTLGSRSLYVRLLKKRPTEPVADYNKTEYPQLEEQLTEVRRKIARWAQDHRVEIRASTPDTKTLSNRVRDNWRPLLKIASVAGRAWLDKAYRAAGIEIIEYDDSLPLKLLIDIRDIFHTRGCKHLPLSTLVYDLALQKESPWRAYRNQREPMNENELSTMLKRDIGIVSKDLAISKDEQLSFFGCLRDKKVVTNGYTREQFKAFFEHQLADVEARIVEVSQASQAL